MRLLLSSLLLLVALPAFGQTNPPSNAVTWTISSPTGVTRFEQSFDTGTTWAPTIPPLPTPVAGVYTGTFPSTLTVGSVFTVSLRACNNAGCFTASPPVGFTYAGTKPTVIPANVTPILQ